eukprot:820085-Rhodomonas_salina.1
MDPKALGEIVTVSTAIRLQACYTASAVRLPACCAMSATSLRGRVRYQPTSVWAYARPTRCLVLSVRICSYQEVREFLKTSGPNDELSTIAGARAYGATRVLDARGPLGGAGGAAERR